MGAGFRAANNANRGKAHRRRASNHPGRPTSARLATIRLSLSRQPLPSKGCGLSVYGPTMNINRDPRWGRNQESVSEDPYLNGAYAAALVRGVQGDDPRYLQVRSRAPRLPRAASALAAALATPFIAECHPPPCRWPRAPASL